MKAEPISGGRRFLERRRRRWQASTALPWSTNGMWMPTGTERGTFGSGSS